MFTYPIAYPIQIKIVGLLSSSSFQRLKHCVKQLHEKRQKIFSKPNIISLVEFDWMEYINILCKEAGRLAWMRETEVAVFWNKRFIGDDNEFYNTLNHRFYSSNFYSPEISYENIARLERIRYFSRDPDKAYVFIDVTLNNKRGRLLFELHSDLLPRTCSYFMKLCLAHPLKDDNISYIGTKMHRLCISGWIQGGDLKVGLGEFDDESYAISHNQRGILSLCNHGKNTNRSQFFITLKPSTWMDGYYVAIGRLVEGYFVLNALEDSGMTYECPDVDISICNCGVLPYGRGIKIRQNFVHQIIKEIRKKWKHFTEKVIHKKHSKSSTILEYDLYDVLLGYVDVDTNVYYLIAKILSIQPQSARHEYNLQQYFTTLLLDAVYNIVKVHELPEDVVDENETSSNIFTEENFEKGLYSIPSLENSLKKLIEVCIETRFFEKAKQLQEEVLKLINIKDSIERLPVVSNAPESDETSHKPSLSNKKTKAETENITWMFNEEEEIRSIKFAEFEQTYTDKIHEENDFKFDPVEEIINELLTDVLTKSNVITGLDHDALKGSITKLMKSILDDLLEAEIKYDSEHPQEMVESEEAFTKDEFKPIQSEEPEIINESEQFQLFTEPEDTEIMNNSGHGQITNELELEKFTEEFENAAFTDEIDFPKSTDESDLPQITDESEPVEEVTDELEQDQITDIN